MATAGYAALIVTLCWCIGGVSPIGEDVLHLDRVATWDTPWSAFSRHLQPARPLQWSWLYAAHTLFGVSPAAARLPAFSLHAVLVVAVHMWLRLRGVSYGTTLLAATLVLVAPVHVHLVWLCAIGYPVRALCAFGAAVLWWQHVRDFSTQDTSLAGVHRSSGWWTVLLYAVCLLAHESAIFMAPVFVLAWWLVPVRAGLGAVLRNRATVALLLLALWRVLDLLVVRTSRQYSLHDFGAVPANVARVAFHVLPEFAREALLDGLRGVHGNLGFAASASVFGLIIVLGAFLFVRGDGFQRFLLSLALMDAVPQVLFVGVGVRYVHVAAPLVAVALASFSIGRPSRDQATRALLLAIVVSWVFQGLRSLEGIRAADDATRALIADVEATLVAEPSTKEIVLVDVPGLWGVHGQLPFLSWGTRERLHRAGISKEIVIDLVRTRPAATSNDHRPIDPSALGRLRLASGVVVLDYDASTNRLKRRGP
ncbi:MAG: hypothetical protein H6832_08700 [Planctomycetes bacterium]|nr:hypothetical protein [Planctomycetota bacterium]